MPLSWNEIRHNAVKFARDHKHATSESADKQTFWNEFFAVFGVPRRTVASFEVPVLKTSGNFGKIDLLWKGTLLVEHKSAGEDLGKAKTQAFDYIQAMFSEGRQKEIPRYVVVSDFARIVLYDLEDDTRIAFPLAEFHKHIHDFAFIPGYKQHKFKEEDPINIEAAEILGQLHDALEAGGFAGHDLERFLVRVLFCLFAEDTGLFPRRAFELYLEENAFVDMGKIGPSLEHLFQVLNTPVEKRQANLSAELQEFPYVNGELFAERLAWADFGDEARQALRQCCGFDWSRISPAIFGSLFQSIMQPKERRQIGAHYTSERDILKVARSLFLDDLREEFARIVGRPLTPTLSPKWEREKQGGASDPLAPIGGEGRGEGAASGMKRKRLENFHKKLCSLKFLDPACGCGNFLVITYRELRQLELETLQALYGGQKELTLDEVNRVSQVDVDQFYGIEIEEWPSRIAEVALWLMDHQMNQKISEAFGQLYQRLPLKKSPHIHCANALRKDWKEVLPPAQCSYILGNPPFVGAKHLSAEQTRDMELITASIENGGLLDLVTAWYFKAAEYIQGSRIQVGFVSTNSISQGEQVGVLWSPLFQRYNLKIHFAHRTFSWESEARGKAHVHVVIIGFGAFDTTTKRIYDYEGETATVVAAKNISPYLIEGTDMTISNRSKPICNVPDMGIGNKPIDDGNYLFTAEEKREFLKTEPAAKEYIHAFFGADDFLQGEPRWCLWLGDCSPQALRQMPEVMKRVEAVKLFREASKSAPTRKLATTPTRFHVENIPTSPYLLIPRHSSERRKYIPIGYVKPEILAGDSCLIISGTTLFHFGVLSSELHMAWVKQICGRLESRYRYSNKLVYNNYPWPESATDKQRAAVAAKAQAVLAARAVYLAVGDDVRSLKSNPKTKGDSASQRLVTSSPTNKACTLADLYDPLAMPPELVKAHAELDRAVEKCYRSEPFKSDRERVEFLFGLYEKLTAPLLPATRKTRGRKAKGLYSQKLPSPPTTPESEAAAAAFHNIMGKEVGPEYKTP